MKGINLLIIPILALALKVLAQYSANAAETNQAPFIAMAPYTGDDFEDGVIDTQKWEVVHNSSNGPDAIEQNGVIRLWNGGDLATREDFWPTPEKPLRVSGRLNKPVGVGTELSVFLRSTGYQLMNPTSALTGVWGGIRVHIRTSLDNVWAEIGRFAYDNNLGLHHPPRTDSRHLFSGASENLDFEIIDDGTNISLTVTTTGNPAVSNSLTYSDDHYSGTTSRVVFSSATISVYWTAPRFQSFQEIELEDVVIESDPNPSAQLLEDTVRNIGGFFISDPDALDVDIQATLSVDHGSLDLIESARQSMVVVQPDNLVLTGTQQEIVSDLGAGVRYTPDANFFGSDTLTITVNDLGQTGGGGAQETSLSVPIAVTAVNDAPVATDDAYEVAEHGRLEIDAVNGVLANDLDVDNDPLTLEWLTNPQFGTLELNPNGSFTYRNWGGGETTDSFTYRISDGVTHSLPASVVINILPINDAPRLGLEAGRALSFDGTSDGVRIDNPPAMDGSFTVEFRARHTPESFAWAFGRGERGSNKNLILGFRQDSTFTMAFHPNNLDTPQPYPDTDWHHWATVYDFDESTGLGSRAIYRDGELIAQDHGIAPVAATGPIYLGTWSEPGFEYAGDLDEVRIWSIARNQVEIQRDMNAPVLGARLGLEGLYHFDETGATAIDTSGHGRDGVLLHADPDGSRFSRTELAGQGAERMITLVGHDNEGANVGFRVTSLPASGELFQVSESETGVLVRGTPVTQASLPVVVTNLNGRLIYRRSTAEQTGPDVFTVVADDGVIQSGNLKVWLDVDNADIDVFIDGAPIESGAAQRIDFGLRGDDDPVSVKTVLIQNNSALTPLIVTPSSSPAGFSLGVAPPNQIGPSESATFSIQFDADAPGHYSGTVDFNTNDPDEQNYSIPVEGWYDVPSMKVSVDDAEITGDPNFRIDFGPHDSGNPGVDKTIVVINESRTSLRLTNLSLPTGYSLVGPFPSEVAPFLSAAFTVQFNASTPAIYEGAIAFETNDPDQPVYEVAVIGSVGAPTAIVSNLAEQGSGSIREAVEYSVARGGTITFDPSLNGEHIRLTAPIELIRDVTIDGTGVDVSLSNTAGGSVFRIARETTVELDSLKLLVESTADDGLIYNTGRLTVKNSTLKGHHSFQAPGIGSIGIIIHETQERIFAELSVENTVIEKTRSRLWQGGGIWSRSTNINLVDVTIRECTSPLEGGGIYHRLGALTMQGCLIEGNRSESYGGGGIYAEGTTDDGIDVNISSSTIIRNNNALQGGGTSRGGGIAVINGKLEASDLEVSGNTAGIGAGLFVNAPKQTAKLDGCSIRDNGGASQGAGIYCRGSLDILRSTISDNRSSGFSNAQGGGIYVDVPSGEFRLRESTVSGNTAHRASSGLFDFGEEYGGSNALGAGLFLTSSSQENPCVIENCTIVGNVSSIESNPGALPPDRYVGGVYLADWTAVTVSGSIIAGNRSPSEFRDVNAGTNGQFVGNQYNLIGEPGPTVGFDFAGTDSSFATLGISNLAEVLELTLQDNGGVTQTHSLVPGSPAIDAGNPQTGMDANQWDQRGAGYRRVNDGLSTGTARIDIGAVEYLHTEPVVIEVPAAEVVGRLIFYNHSAWDGHTAGSNALDDNAIATDKSALLPGQIATFSNYTSYSHGINGIMIDIANLAGNSSAADFTFKVGNNNDPSGWSAAPGPAEIAVRSGAGVNGSDRVTLLWSNNTIENKWLQVTVLATATTGLTTPDVFFFGNAIGECGNSTANAYVDVSDENASRNNPRNFLNLGPITDVYDYNRDRKVDITDQNLVRNHNTNFLTALKLIDLTAVGSDRDGIGQRSVSHAMATTHSSITGISQQNPIADERVVEPAPSLQILSLSDGWIAVTTKATHSYDYVLQTTDNIGAPSWETVSAPANRNSEQDTIQWVIDTRSGQAKGFFQVLRYNRSATSNAQITSDR